jgi:hypothetical protein
VRALLSVLRAIPNDLRAAAATLGASPVRAWWQVDARALRRPLLAGAGFSAAISLGEFGATTILSRSGTETLPIAIGRLLGRAGALPQAQAFAMATILLVLSTVVVMISGFCYFSAMGAMLSPLTLLRSALERFEMTEETVVSHGGTKPQRTDQRTQSDRVFPTKREPSAEEQKAGGYEVDGPKRPPLPVTPVASNLAYGQKRAPTDGPLGEKHDAAALICDRQFRSHSLHSLRPSGQPISGGRRPPYCIGLLN